MTIMVRSMVADRRGSEAIAKSVYLETTTTKQREKELMAITWALET